MWGFERQPAANLLDDVFGLIVTEMMFAPEAKGLPDDFVERMRDRLLTTQFAPRRAFRSGHDDLESVIYGAVTPFCAVSILYCLEPRR